MCNKRIVVDEISDDLSANIMLFGYRPAGRMARWVTCVLTAKHKAALLYGIITKKLFETTKHLNIVFLTLKRPLLNIIIIIYNINQELLCYKGPNL